MTILDEIFARKHKEVARRKRQKSLGAIRDEAEQAASPAGFISALHASFSSHHTPALIAEVKKASPSKGLLAPNLDPLRLALIYQQNGAAAISVLTDEHYFQGHLDFLREIATLQPRLPLLCKDFFFDPYQLYEARAAGADAILLITAHLGETQLRDLYQLAYELEMASLVEVHSEKELEKALKCDPVMVGINSRDLHNFSVNLETTLHLCARVPKGVCLVAESGIHTLEDVQGLAVAGVHAILVGEALVTAPDVAKKVRELSVTG
jgi:indole-3-glycerol phosphate synthase